MTWPSKDGKRQIPLELDVWIPDLRIGFEYQVCVCVCVCVRACVRVRV